MIQKASERAVVWKQSHGGAGQVKMTEILAAEELDGTGSFFSVITIPPGSSIGYHVHRGEAETILVVSGTGESDDGQRRESFQAGDVLRVSDGGGHSLRATGTGPVELVCLVVYT